LAISGQFVRKTPDSSDLVLYQVPWFLNDAINKRIAAMSASVERCN
jgi:hypothetical protein